MKLELEARCDCPSRFVCCNSESTSGIVTIEDMDSDWVVLDLERKPHGSKVLLRIAELRRAVAAL